MRRILLSLLAAGTAACTAPAPEFLYDEAALGPYSSAVIVGDLVLLSGKIGAQRTGTFEEEVASCIDAVEAGLREAGLELSDAVEARVYLTDINHYAAFNGIYAARFSKPYPARTCVAVKELPAGARVEIQVAARR
ncbi:MAG: Rid family hydrolase [Planctomycetota bacterium]|nr:Rid family hydrolase [Planctomycetota bacterium]